MALRVLLADESSTIKKVFQLALQDYAVEVQSVNVGIDVPDVARQFKPDIVFADILLQKRSGYDISSDIKADPELASLPVVLIWSGFMELDEDKFQASKADAHLEKPFDVKILRKLIQTLVPKTKTQKISRFLTFPKLPEFEENPPKSQTEAESPPLPPPHPVASEAPAAFSASSGAGIETVEEDGSAWNMESFEPIEEFVPQGANNEDFQQVQLATEVPPTPAETTSSPSEILEDLAEDKDQGWVRENLGRFQVDADANLDTDDDDLAVDYMVPDESAESDDSLHATDSTVSVREFEANDLDGDIEVEELEVEEPEKVAGANSNLSAEELEHIIRAQSKDIIEAVVWKVVPELASQIIEKELNRLLAERKRRTT